MTERNNPGDFKKGHQLWRNRTDPVKPKKFPTPTDLHTACCEYFEWLEKNPLREQKVFHHQGKTKKAHLNKMRMPTIEGLCVFIGISRETWYQYAKRKRFDKVTNWVGSVIWDWKLTAAAAGLLDGGLVGRHLGLADKKDHTSSDGSMSPKPVVVELVGPDGTSEN